MTPRRSAPRAGLARLLATLCVYAFFVFNAHFSLDMVGPRAPDDAIPLEASTVDDDATPPLVPLGALALGLSATWGMICSRWT